MLQLGAIADELNPNILRALDVALELGLEQVELHTAWDRTVAEWTDAQVAWLGAELKHRDLKVCCISSTVFLRCRLDDAPVPIPPLPGFRSIAGSYTQHLAALGRCLDVAQELGAPLLRVFGFWRTGSTTQETTALAAECLAQAAQMAAPTGVRLALENCPHTFFDWGQRALELVERVASPHLGMLWDPCSALRSAEPDYLAPATEIARCLLHVHAKDMRLDSRLKRGRQYVPILDGLVDWVEIFGRLKRSDWEGVVCLETHHNGPDGRRESAARASFEGLLRVYRENYIGLEGVQ